MCHFISICAMLCHFMLYFISFFLIWGDITFRAILCHLSILGSLKIQFVLCLYEDIFCLAQNLSSSVKIDIASSRCHRIIIIMVIKIIKIVKISIIIKITIIIMCIVVIAIVVSSPLDDLCIDISAMIVERQGTASNALSL